MLFTRRHSVLLHQRIEEKPAHIIVVSGPRQVDKSTLFRDGYIAARSGHSRGSTVDLTLANRANGKALDMGTPFDFFSPRSWPSDRTVSAEAQSNRALLTQSMRKRGFRPYDKEWWHFTLRHEPYPETYFDFPVR